MKITIYSHDGKNYTSIQMAQFEKAAKIIQKFSEVLYEFDNLNTIKKQFKKLETQFEITERKLKELEKIALENIDIKEIEIEQNINIQQS